MLLDLRGFRSGTDEVVRQFAPGAFELAGEDFRIVAPVQLTARLTKDNEKVRLVGRLQTMLEADCGRCLDPLTIPVDANLDVLFLPELDQTHAASAGGGKDDDEAEVREADTGVSFYKNDTIDLGEIMRDEFYLAVPMKPLCRPDCPGLCPECGARLDGDHVAHATEELDPRLASLARFLDRDN